jgi:hypothetical protein
MAVLSVSLHDVDQTLEHAITTALRRLLYAEYLRTAHWQRVRALGTITSVLSSTTSPFGQPDLPCFEERSDRPEFFLDRSLECCRVLAQVLSPRQQVLGLTRVGRR